MKNKTNKEELLLLTLENKKLDDEITRLSAKRFKNSVRISELRGNKHKDNDLYSKSKLVYCIISDFCDKYSLDIDLFLSNERSREYSLPRKILSYILSVRFDISPYTISRYLRVPHSSIYYYLKTLDLDKYNNDINYFLKKEYDYERPRHNRIFNVG